MPLVAIRIYIQSDMHVVQKIAKNGLNHAVQRVYYKLTANERVLPDFLILGAQKAGTTSLYHYLIQHPQILPSFKKEVRFFDKHFHKGIRWYRAYFPTRKEMESAERELEVPVLTGESSPTYLHFPLAARRIADVAPGAKLIVLMRDPVARAYSHYHHNVRRGREPLSFEKAIAREAERLDGERERMLADPRYRSRNHMHYAYLGRGRYAEQVEEYLSYFEIENLLAVSSEEFFKDTQPVIDLVCDFLDIQRFTLQDRTPRNVASYNKKKIPNESELREYFAPHNRKLSAILGEDFGW